MADDKSTTSQDDERFSLTPPPAPLPRGQTPKRRAYMKALQEANKEKYAAYLQQPEVKARRAANAKRRYATPEGKAKSAAINKKYYEKNKVAYLKRIKEYRDANPDRVHASLRKSHLLAKYGLTPEQHQEMIEASGGRCQICKVILSDLINEFPCIDHCHRTGMVRGIICTRCNRMLGLAHDNPKILRQAARYLEKATAVQ